MPPHHLHHVGSRGRLHFCDSKLTAKINSSAWVCLSSLLLMGSGAVTSLRAPAASSTPDSPVSYGHPKACSFQPVPSHPPQAAPCSRQTEPFPSWQFGCCCPQHHGERGAVVLPMPARPAHLGPRSLCGGPSMLPKRGASLQALKINGLGLEQLLGKPLCFRVGQSI